MDLLRLVLIRSSAEQLLKLSRELPRVIRERLLYDWIKLRTEFTDNRLIDCLRQLGYSTEAERFNSIFYLASYAGEPTAVATGNLTGRMIMARWAFLQQSRSSGNMGRSDIYELDISLMSGIPLIQVEAVENARTKFTIPDPEIIPWTPEVVAYYESLFHGMSEEELYSGSLTLAGYLQIDILSKISLKTKMQDYIGGYLLAMMQKSSDHFAAIPELDQLMAKYSVSPIDTYMNCFYAGYFPPHLLKSRSWVDLLGSAFIYVRPDLVRRLLQIDRQFVVDGIRVQNGLPITHSLVARAREMLTILDKRYPRPSIYRAQLRALCGLPIDTEYLEAAKHIMLSVAHPQVTADILGSIGSRYPSSVYYDLVNFFRVGTRYSDRSIFASYQGFADRELTLLYVQGKLLDAYDPNDLPALRASLRALW